MVSFRATTRTAVLIVILCSIALDSRAQTQGLHPGILQPLTANPLLELQSRIGSDAVRNTLLAMEGAIDAEDYILGPGDLLKINIGGILPISRSVSVSITGNLALPDAGIISAAERTLAEVVKEAQAALREQHRNVPVDIYLQQPRLFYVHVTGSVPEPGRYLMIPLSRVDNAVFQAYFSAFLNRAVPVVDDPSNPTSEEPIVVSSPLTPPARERPKLNENYRPALRNVSVTHRDGSQQSVDLIRYYTFGDTKDNPYLRDGDVIAVHSFHASRDGVRVSGQVQYPGIYDLRPGDTVRDVLSLASGPGGLEALDTVRLARSPRSSQTETMILSLDGPDSTVALQASDHIIVPVSNPATAAIQGRIQYPGTYQILDGKTTLRELVDMAGGPKADANLRSAFIERRKSLDFLESERISNLDFFSRHFAQSFTSQPAIRVNVDIEAALKSDSADVILYDGDRVVFPRDENTVHVYGQVPQPGLVRFVEGQSISEYIEAAGGSGPGSRAVYVFDGATGEVRKGEGGSAKSGDTIFVDRMSMAETPEIAQLLFTEKRSKRTARIQTTQVIVAGVTAITSVITTVVAVRSLNQ